MKAEFLERGIRAIKIFLKIILNGNTIYKNEGVIVHKREEEELLATRTVFFKSKTHN